MSESISDYMTTQQAAAAIGIEYSTLMARVRKKKILSIKMGWNTLIHKDEVKRAKQVEDKKNAHNNKNLEGPAR